jgi:ribosome-binding protein aMBF1 (putative translation factor)
VGPDSNRGETVATTPFARYDSLSSNPLCATHRPLTFVRGQRNAWDRIRTGGPLRDSALNAAPLAWLGYPRTLQSHFLNVRVKALSFAGRGKRTIQYGEYVTALMPKYSTGDGGSGAGETCELCGASDADLQTVNVAGAKLEVCAECAQHDDTVKTTSSDSDQDDRDRRKRAAQNTARMHDASANDPSHWENGVEYDDDRLPYLVEDYDQRLTTARQDAGLKLQELAEEIEVDESDLLALEQGRATQAGVGGSVVGVLEEYLGIDLVES